MKRCTAREQKRLFLENETALNQSEASLILGCRPRDVNEIMAPSFYWKGRPKYRQRDVLACRNKLMKLTKKLYDPALAYSREA